MNRLRTKIKRIYHLFYGLYRRCVEKVKRQKAAWWKSQIGKRKYIKRKIQTGIRMRLYLDSRLSEQIFCEDFELTERQFVNDFLKKGDIFVDVGANIGLFTLIAAHRIGKDGHVYAFEPCAMIYRRLCENVRLNHLANVFCYNIALSDENAQADLKIPMDGYYAWSSLGYPCMGTEIKQERVQMVRWDNFARENNLVGKVTMMKIDVEGWEAHVLAGGYEIFSRNDAPVLQVEFTEEAAKGAGSSCIELYHLLERLGFKMFIYDQAKKKLIYDPLREQYPYLNVIAVKNSEFSFSFLEKRGILLSR